MERIEGLSIGLSLDTININSGLKDLKSKLSTVNSEIKANLAGFDRADRSIGKYQTTLAGLNKKLQVQSTITEKARRTYKKMVDEHGEGSVEAEKAARAFNNESAKLQNLQRSVDRTASELKELQNQQRLATSGWGKFSKQAEKTGEKLTNIGSGLKGVGQSMSMYITAPLVGLGVAAVNTAKDFEAQMSRVGAIAGATSSELDELRESALELGASTSKSASEVAQGQETLAAMGFTVQEILGAMPGVISAAEASGSDMAQTADVMASALNIFGLEASEASRVADVLAQTANQSSADLTDMQYALKYAGPPAAALGVGLEELSASIGIMTDAGMKGEQAGTTLRGALLGLLDPSEENSKLMDTMGVAITDNEGNFVGLAQLVRNLQESMEGQTDTQKAATLAALVGKEAVSGMLSLMAAGPDEIEKMTKSLEESGGMSAETAKKMKDNLGGALEELGGAFETAGIAIGNLLTPAIKSLAGMVQGLVQRFIDMSPAAQKVSLVFAAIAAAIGPLLVVAGVMISTIGSILKVLAPLAASIAKAGGLIKWLRLGLVALSGPIGITIGIITALATGFILLYKNSDTFRTGVGKLAEKLKELGGRILDGLKTAVSAVADFFRSQMKVLQVFWNQNSETIMAALRNIGKVVSVIFKGIMAVIQFVMPAVLAIIKSIWNNIKGVIQGTLKVIMGLVQVFAGLLSGDFSKMWSGIKKIFSGALQAIWNGVQLMFWGKMLKGIVGLGKTLTGTFKSMWSSIQKTFSTVIKAIVDFVKNSFNTMRNGINSVFTGIKNFITGIWKAIRTNIQNPVKAAVDFTKSRFGNLKDKTVEIFSNIKKKVTGYVSDMVTAVRNMPGKMKDGLVKMSSKITEGVTTVANKMTKGLGKGVNGVINGVNWVTDKLGIKSKISEWDVPQYAKGTKGHPGGLAVVGDGKGRNAGSELIQTPDGKTMLSPANDTLVNLPKGSQVLSALETKSLLGDIPKYAKGIGGMIQSGVKKAKDFALNIWDYATNPGKLLDIALETLGVSKPDNSNLVGKIARGGFNKVKDSAVNYVKDMFAKSEAEGGNVQAPNFGGRFRRTSGFGPRWGRLHGGVDYAAPIGTPIPSQSNGVVSFAANGWNGGFGNLVKVKQGIYEHFYAHMSRIMTRAGQRVSKGSILGLVGSTGDSTGPHVHYELRKNGVRLNPGNVGFATGGLINNPGMYNLAEGGFPEWVIPTDPKRRTDAMKLLALAGRDISGNKRPNQLPNVSGGNDPLLMAVLEQNQMTMEQNKLLMALLQSSQNIEKKPVLTEGDVGRATERYDAGQTIKKNIFSGRGAWA